jgi:hypothetical protein
VAEILVKVLKVTGIAVLALISLLTLAPAVGAQPSAGSYDVNITCGDFSNDQAAAQAYFDANGQPANLDQNGDGLACADPEDGDFTAGPSAGSYDVNITCADFSGDSAAAQDYFDANDAPANLDQNGDGVACNDDTVVAAAGVMSLPNTGAGQSQSDSSLMLMMGLVAGLAGAAFMIKRSKA